MSRNTVVLAESSDAKTVVEWENITHNGNWNTELGLYPSSLTFKSLDRNNEPVVFMPTHRPFMFGPLAIRPGATHFAVTSAMRAMLRGVASVAKEVGSGEMYFWGAEESMKQLAIRAGFEHVAEPMYRMKVTSMKELLEV